MKAISLWQPWASAVALGMKHNETRSWPTNYRGLIAIHAAKKTTGDLKRIFDSFMCRGNFAQPFVNAKLYSFMMLPKGSIVAVAELAEVFMIRESEMKSLLCDLEFRLGDYRDGRWAWVFSNVRPLKDPYFFVGHQGLFDVDVPEHLLSAV